jgi:hypothetical protein
MAVRRNLQGLFVPNAVWPEVPLPRIISGAKDDVQRGLAATPTCAGHGKNAAQYEADPDSTSRDLLVPRTNLYGDTPPPPLPHPAEPNQNKNRGPGRDNTGPDLGRSRSARRDNDDTNWAEAVKAGCARIDPKGTRQ